jgi:hypothetical protein
VFPPVQGNPGVLQVTTRTPRTEKVVEYFFKPLPCDWNGFGYRVEKIGPLESEGPYSVYLDAEGGLDGHHSCDCRGFLSAGHCLHCSALLALHQSGQL